MPPAARIVWILPAVAACLLALLLFVPPARAVGGPGPAGYAATTWTGCTAGTNGGSWDDAGRVYVPCGSPAVINVFDAAGHRVQTIATGRAVTEAAPTRDGAFIYLAGPGAPVSRMVRTASGTYAADPSWQPQQYTIWGSSKYAPLGHYIAVDRAGFLYVAHGMWVAGAPHTVIKYHPNGTPVTRFGEWDNSWNAGTFYWSLAGIAVSDDGATVYTAEVGNDRVQTWTRQANGSYRAAPTWFGDNAANTPDRHGGNDCDYVGRYPTLAAVYDVSLDRTGNLYVLNTTCKQVLKFAPGFTGLLANLDVRTANGARPHGMAVAADGTVYVGENDRVWRADGVAQPSDGVPASGVVSGGAPASTPASGAVPASGAASGKVPGAGHVTPRPSRPPSAAADRRARDTRAPRVRLARSAVRALRSRRGTRTVRATPRCNERCRVEVRVSSRGRTIARRVAWRGRNVSRRIDARIRTKARVRRGTRVTVQLRIRDRAGNSRTIRRKLTLR